MNPGQRKLTDSLLYCQVRWPPALLDLLRPLSAGGWDHHLVRGLWLRSLSLHWARHRCRPLLRVSSVLLFVHQVIKEFNWGLLKLNLSLVSRAWKKKSTRMRIRRDDITVKNRSSFLTNIFYEAALNCICVIFSKQQLPMTTDDTAFGRRYIY